MGYMESDLLWRHALDQVKCKPIQRQLFVFAQVLLEGMERIINPLALWNERKHGMCPPLGLKFPHLTEEELRHRQEQTGLSILFWHLQNQGKTLKDFNLPSLDNTVPAYNPAFHGENAQNYLAGEDDVAQPARQIPEVELMTDQKRAFDKIVAALKNSKNVFLTR
jgi:hypothetical protein